MMHHNTLAAIVRRLSPIRPLDERYARPWGRHEVLSCEPCTRRLALVRIAPDADQDDCLKAAKEELESCGLTVDVIRWDTSEGVDSRETILAWVRL